MITDQIDPYAVERVDTLADAMEDIGIEPVDVAGALISRGLATLMTNMGVDPAAAVIEGLAAKMREAHSNG